MNAYRWAMHYLFGRVYVFLVTHRGDRMIKRAYRLGGHWWANPYLPETRCKLLPGGKAEGQSYIVGWEPCIPELDGGALDHERNA